MTFSIQVDVARPGNRPDLLVHGDPLEYRGVAQRRERLCAQQRRDVNVANLAVGEHHADDVIRARGRGDDLGGDCGLHRDQS